MDQYRSRDVLGGEQDRSPDEDAGDDIRRPVGSQVDSTHRDDRDCDQQKSDGGPEPYSPLRHDQHSRNQQSEDHDRDDDVTARKRSETGPDQGIKRARTIDDHLDEDVGGYAQGEHDRNRVGKRPAPTPQDCRRCHAEDQGHPD